MRIKNKYLRNRLAKIKARKRAVKFVGGEFSYKCFFPYWFHGVKYSTCDQQIKDHSQHIDEWWVRGLLNGHGRGHWHAPKWYKKSIERRERRKVQKIIKKMMYNIEDVDDVIVPTFIHQADWGWF